MKDATGPLGSERSARERCTASATDVTAVSCPITRVCSSASSCNSLAFSDATSLATGTPVQRDTTAAMSASVTSSLDIRPESLEMAMISLSVRTYSIFALATSSESSAVSLSARAASFSACLPAASTLAAASASPAAAALARASSTRRMLVAAAACFALAFARRRSPKDRSAAARLWSRLAFCSFSSSPAIFFCFAFSAESDSFRPCRHAAAILDAAPGLYFSSASFARIWSRSLVSCATLRSVSSKSSGFIVFCMRTAAAASSSRSMALSGRHRPLTYRAESFAAATTALSLILIAWCCSYLARNPRSTETVCASSGSGTGTCWNRRSSAASCSMVFLNFSVVDAPMHLSKPRPSAGLRIAAPLFPAGGGGHRLCMSSMNITTGPFCVASTISETTMERRSSNSPGIWHPAPTAPRSSSRRRALRSGAGTSPAMIRCARPSTIAVLPTPD
mmetsp:Transcript_15624/g.65861  ORF Transcript_15624/g.65861 Transcript_15624/m.65861 type:complete len:451 (-) Transcript_15624:537-1889(-)